MNIRMTVECPKCQAPNPVYVHADKPPAKAITRCAKCQAEIRFDVLIDPKEKPD